MSDFSIQKTWLKPAPKAGRRSAMSATMARLKIILANRTITEYSGEHEHGSEGLEIPAYFLAEWAAENWWPLLWEPRKSEDAPDDADFLIRHSVLTAQHGFALPRLVFVPHGEQIAVTAAARNVQFADIRFRNSASATLPRKMVESTLRKFVGDVVSQLKDQGFHDTDLQAEWELIERTDEEEAEFCRLLGALGLSPYAENARIVGALERASTLLSPEAIMDLCLVSSPTGFETAAELAISAVAATSDAVEASLEPLATTSVPADNLSTPAWHRGVNAARSVRDALGISEIDPEGGSKFFEKLSIEPRKSTYPANNEPEQDEAPERPIVGAVSRDALKSRFALLQRKTPQRRFTAARAAYMAWVSEKQQSHRLITMAVTRDQQASRAFAAELMAPLNFLKKHAKKSTLSMENIYILANELQIGPDVVSKQVLNNGLRITA